MDAPVPPPASTASPVYTLIRGTQLVLTASVIPLGVWGYLQRTNLGLDMGMALFPVLGLTFVFAAFVVLFEQGPYPLTTLGALQRTGPALVNFGLAYFRGDGDGVGACLWSLTSLLASSLALLGSAFLQLGRRKDLPSYRGVLYGFVVCLMVGLGAALSVMGGALLTTMTPSVVTLLAVMAWVSQSVGSARAWIAYNEATLAAQDTPSPHQAAMQGWNGRIMAAILLTTALTVVLFLFRSMK